MKLELYFVLIIIVFMLGILFDRLLIGKQKFKFLMIEIYNKIKRFLQHTISISAVFIVLIITYYISERIFNYGSAILPNLISTGLSILIIDFLLKERSVAEKEKVNFLIKDKISNVKSSINKIILKFINLDEMQDSNLSNELITNILSKQKLDEKVLDYIEITPDGQVNELKISKFDLTYYISREIEPEVTNLIQNFNQYLTVDEICILTKLNDVLKKNKIFKVKFSNFEKVNGEEYEFYKNLLISAIIELNSVLGMLNRGDGKHDYKQ